MREIKFRMWNQVKGSQSLSRMFYDIPEVMECLKQQILFNNGSKHGYNHIGDGNHFMLYSGNKDKNGVEIYEDDIYHMGDKNIIYVVVWHDSGLIGKQKGSSSYAGISYWKEKIEVIGNIHQNPELLK